MLYKKWIDFVIYPLDSNRVLTREQRLDTSKAIRVTDLNYTPDIGTERGTVYTKNLIIFDFDNDEFEAIAIGITGSVTIWTRKRVWSLCKLEVMERMIFFPRNPNSDPDFLIAHKIEIDEK